MTYDPQNLRSENPLFKNSVAKKYRKQKRKTNGLLFFPN